MTIYVTIQGRSFRVNLTTRVVESEHAGQFLRVDANHPLRTKALFLAQDEYLSY